MEPFRILIDRKVVRMMPTEFTSREKYALLDVLNDTVTIDNSRQTVLNAMRIFCRSAFAAMREGDVALLRFLQ